MNEIKPLPDSEHALAEGGALTYNFAAVLPGRASSQHTQRAYFRWVDKYLTDVAGMRALPSDERMTRMRALPVDKLRQSLTAPQLRAWLGGLVAGGAGKQGANQARASIITLASLLSEAGWLDDYTSASMRNVRLPSAADGQRPGRWLSLDQVKMLMMAARRIGTTENQIVRNNLAITMLCTMALRRDELAS